MDSSSRENCPLCLTELLGQTYSTHCEHYFHRECLELWYNLNSQSCPICRLPLVMNEWFSITGPQRPEVNVYAFYIEYYDFEMEVESESESEEDFRMDYYENYNEFSFDSGIEEDYESEEESEYVETYDDYDNPYGDY